MNPETNPLTAATRTQLDQVGRALLRLHKSLLDDERVIYETVHGPLASPHELFQLVLHHPQFTWLGKISSLIALLDEASSVRRPTTEDNAQALLAEARLLLKMEGEDETFAERLRRVVKRSPAARALYDEAAKIAMTENE